MVRDGAPQKVETVPMRYKSNGEIERDEDRRILLRVLLTKTELKSSYHLIKWTWYV